MIIMPIDVSCAISIGVACATIRRDCWASIGGGSEEGRQGYPIFPARGSAAATMRVRRGRFPKRSGHVERILMMDVITLPLFADPSRAGRKGRFVSRLRDFHIKDCGGAVER